MRGDRRAGLQAPGDQSYRGCMTKPTWVKLLKGNPINKTRFHNSRGQILPWREVPSAIASVGHRILGRYREGPWMTPAAVRRLDELLDRDMTLLELGSGVSTSWYARKTGLVVSLEPNAMWADKVRNEISSFPNCELRGTDIETELRRQGEGFDVVIVDFDSDNQFTRDEAVRLVAGVARRILVLDDSDRPEYAAADAYMHDWKSERFVGMKSTPLGVVETTIYTR